MFSLICTATNSQLNTKRLCIRKLSRQTLSIFQTEQSTEGSTVSRVHCSSWVTDVARCSLTVALGRVVYRRMAPWSKKRLWMTDNRDTCNRSRMRSLTRDAEDAIHHGLLSSQWPFQASFMDYDYRQCIIAYNTYRRRKQQPLSQSLEAAIIITVLQTHQNFVKWQSTLYKYSNKTGIEFTD